MGPYVRDDMVLDRIVLAVALDWRDFGREKAHTRLQYELDRQRIGLQVGDDNCTFGIHEDGIRTVRCRWEAQLTIPFTDVSRPLQFESLAHLSVDGDLL